ncbi:carboxypeptidase regulatory-like domain-containing protein [Candidatus Thorarchaeota archaeon]|nr:MAG: carboxypeptidase regulatory-like domain-containing protein [Candidatus Thorarchaeota archaeon]
MKKKAQLLASIIILLFATSSAMPFLIDDGPATTIDDIHIPMTLSATDLVVENRTFNYNKEFNDDDFFFEVNNGTQPIAGANVSLYNATDDTKYDTLATVGDGSAVFYNVPQGTYKWNVTWDEAPEAVEEGVMVSDGPEAFADVEIGNLDWENDDDDLNATVVDIDGDPAEGLDFQIVFRDNSTIWSQQSLDADGEASFTEIPIQNYTWKVVVPFGDYAGTELLAENFTADGTQLLSAQRLGLLGGDPEYYDLEVFTYYETSLFPLSDALVNVTFKNGTEIESKTTPSNGTVLILDLPAAFVNWSVIYNLEELASGYQNLSVSTSDLRSPVIESPGDIDVLYDNATITVTWQIYDEYPSEIVILIDGGVNDTRTWTNETEFTFNATGIAIGTYEITIQLEDQNGNSAEDTISLRVYEDTPPVVEGPDDVEFYRFEAGYSLRWNVSDDYLDSYWILRNDEMAKNGSINPAQPFVTISLDNLGLGVYNYYFVVNDTSGNEASDNVTVTVKRDDVAPEIIYSPDTVIYNRGDLNVIRNWTAEDDYKKNYTISVDGFIVEQGEWTSENIEFDFAGLADGVHYVKLTVYDVGGNSASDTVEVIVGPPLVILGIYTIVGVVVVALVIAVVYWYAKIR